MTIKFMVQRDAAKRMLYIVLGGMEYPSKAALRKAFPSATLEQVKSTRKDKIFG